MKWVILIKSTFKIGTLLLICILLVGQFTPYATFHIHAAHHDPAVLDVGETQHVSVGDTIQLKIKKTDQELQTSTIDFPDNITMDEDNLSHSRADEIDFNTKKNTLTINWDMGEMESEVIVDLLVTDVGDIEIVSHNLLHDENEATQSNQIHITVDPKEEEKEIAGQEEQKSDAKESTPNDKDNRGETNKSDSNEDAIDHDEVNGEQSNKNSVTKENSDEVNVDTDERAKENKIEDPVNELAEVNSWGSFLSALENKNIREIDIISDFSAPRQAEKKYSVHGDKIISGNHYKVDFFDIRMDIQNFNVTVEDLTIKADQTNKIGKEKSSVFFSDHSNGMLHLKDTSFDGLEHAQVAYLLNGHIRISGNSKFQSAGPFEVFEAKNITFEDNAEFVGIAVQTATSSKEVINLYNSPTMTIGKNASVRLKTENKSSGGEITPILKVQDGSAASITLLENATLEVYAINKVKNSGNSLIELPGENSNIFLAQDATFDVLNHREGNGEGGLLHVNGTLSMKASSVAFWDKGADIENLSGDKYRYFPLILDGLFNQSNGKIVNGHAGEGSTLSISDNDAKNGKTFAETFTNRDTREIKRLLISPAEKPQKPVIDTFTDQDDTITGTATPGITVKIRDETNNKTWTTTADATTGKFSILLDGDVRYKPGSILYATAIDSYEFESDQAIINIIGATLEFYVPEALTFQPTMVESEIITILREDPDWSIRISDTREQGSEWEVTAKAESPLTSVDNHQLHEDALVFIQDGQEQSLKETVLIQQGVTEDQQETNIIWGKNEGILIKLNPITSGVQTNKPYSTTIEWTLTDAP